MTTTHDHPTRPSTLAPAEPPDPALVLRLQAARSYPSVSVLMSTRPGAAMHQTDRTRLRALTREVALRLAAEDGGAEEHRYLLHELEQIADAAVLEATGAALGIFVNASTAVRVVLPLPVADRVVVDPTFATRDLVRAMHRTPRHSVLVLSQRHAQLYEGVVGGLRPAPGHRFPLERDRGDARPRGRHPDRPRLHEAEATAFLRDVDAALGAHLAARPMPLVVVGPARLLALFTDGSRNLARLAGTVVGNLGGLPLDELATRIRPVVEAYLRSREAEALALLERRTGEGRTVSGMAAAWLAGRHERPEMLAVEEGLYVPARLSPDGDHLTPADDVDHPDVIDDLVDELIETVLHRGGWVALVSDGALRDHDGVALTVLDRF
ncbi:hypothetical protein Q6346_00595 [Isoptericola sp. b490]|uniref:baeRF3 domain-containing protein n=1 Tax=Actinotalea lenta TaxID=3064654 RepID=UPI0027138B1C|nr:hypothetical protein [Isoptericola sp. b490]MDO8119807.1 hypothetical protein [Isoptericola sp. b490]